MKLRLPKLIKAALLACFATSLSLTMGSASATDIKWTGATGTWSIGAAGLSMWGLLDGATGGVGYEDGDSVTFDVDQTAIITIIGVPASPLEPVLGAGVAPSAIIVSAGTYTFAGEAITAGSLTVSGATFLSLTNDNTSTGLLTIGGGATLHLGTGGATGSWAGAIKFSDVTAGTAGALVINREGTVILGSVTGTAGSILLKKGALQVGAEFLKNTGVLLTIEDGGSLVATADQSSIETLVTLGTNAAVTINNDAKTFSLNEGIFQTITDMSEQAAAAFAANNAVAVGEFQASRALLTTTLSGAGTTVLKGNVTLTNLLLSQGSLAIGLGTITVGTPLTTKLGGSINFPNGCSIPGTGIEMKSGTTLYAEGTEEVSITSDLRADLIGYGKNANAIFTLGKKDSASLSFAGSLFSSNDDAGNAKRVFNVLSNVSFGHFWTWGYVTQFNIEEGVSLTFGSMGISGGGGAHIEKLGAGSLVITGAYTAQEDLKTIRLSAGNLEFRVAEAVGMTNALTGVTGDTGVLVKSGAGTLTLSKANSYIGGTKITEGTLALSGAGTLGTGAVYLEGASELTKATLTLISGNTIANKLVISAHKFGTINNWNTDSTASGITLGHNATYVGDLSMGAQTLTIGAPGIPAGKASVTGTTTFAGTRLKFEVADNKWNVLSLQVLSVTDICTIDLTGIVGSTLNSMDYALLEFTGGLTAVNLSTWFTLTGVGALGGRAKAELKVQSSKLYLSVSSGEVVWTNLDNNGIWAADDLDNKNWFDPEELDDWSTAYLPKDRVSFSDMGGGGIVTIVGLVAPSSIEVSSGLYTFEGDAITAGTLTISNPDEVASLTLENVNTSTGIAKIALANTLTLGGAAGTWAGAIVNNGSLVFDHSADFTFTDTPGGSATPDVASPAITGTGVVIKKGLNTLALKLDSIMSPEIDTFSGGTIVEGGTLRLERTEGSKGGAFSYRFGTGAITIKNGAEVRLELKRWDNADNSWTFVNDWVIDGVGKIRFETVGGNDVLSGNINFIDSAELSFSFKHGINDLTKGMRVQGQLTGGGDAKIILDNSDPGGWLGNRNLWLEADNTSFKGSIQVSNLTSTVYEKNLCLVLNHEKAAVNAKINLEGSLLGDKEERSYLKLNIAEATIAGLTGNAYSQVETQFADGSILTLNDAISGAFAGKITGSNLSINKIGTGTWTVSGDSDYQGGTTIKAGTLKVASLNALGTSGLISLTGGTLEVAVASFARDVTISSAETNTLQGASLGSYTGVITVSGGKLTLGSALGGTADNAINLTGTSSLDMASFASARTLNASGTNTLNGATAFTGVLNVSAGTLTLGAALGASDDNAINLTSTGILDMGAFASARTLNASGTNTLNGATAFTGVLTVSAGTLTLGTALGASDDNAINLTSTGILDMGAFASARTLNASGTNTLNGATAFTGELNVSAGKLTLGTSLGGVAANAINLTSTGSLDMATFASARTLNASGTNTLSAAAFTGVLNVSGGKLTLGSDLGGDGTNAINLTGTSSLNMAAFDSARKIDTSGTNTLSAAAFTGVLNVSAGTLTLGSILGGVAAINLTGTTGTTTLNMATFASARTLNTTGEGNHTLNGATNFTGELNVSAGTLTLGTSLGGVAANAINLTSTGSLDMASFDSARTLNASGTNTLSAAAFTGVLNVSGGKLTLGSDLGGDGAKVINLTDGASLAMADKAVDRHLVVSGAATLSGTAAYTGNVTLAASSNLTVAHLRLANHSLSIGAGNTIAAATITGDLTLGDQSSLAFDIKFDASPATKDTLTLTGALAVTASGDNKAFFDIDFTGTLLKGEYALMTYGGTAISAETFANLDLKIARGRTVVSLEQTSGNNIHTISLVVGDGDSLLWTASLGAWTTVTTTGHVTSGPWVLNSTPASQETDNNFHVSDAVIFGSEGSGTVTIEGDVNPGSMLVDGGAYIFAGDGSIIGRGSLTVSEVNPNNKTSLSLTKANETWTGAIALTGGSLSLAVANAAGRGAISMGGGKLELLVSSAITNNALTYNGGILAFAGTEQVYDVNFTMGSIASMAVDVSTGNSAKLHATGLDSKNITMTGAGSLLLNLATAHAGNVSLDGGKVEFTNTVASSSITGNLTSTSNVSTLSFKSLAMANETRLLGTNTVDSVNVDAHTLVLASAGAMGGSTLSLSNGATLKFEVNQTKNDFALQLTSGNNTLSTGTPAINFAGAITSTLANATTLNLGGTLTLSGAITLNRTGDQLAVLDAAKISLGNAAGNQTVSGLSAATNSVVTVLDKLSMGVGGFTGAGSLALGSGAELTAKGTFTNTLQTTLMADAALNTGAFDVVFSGEVQSGVNTLTKKGTGTLSISNGASNLVVNLSEGTLDMKSSAATLSLTVDATKDVTLNNAGSLNAASTTSIAGTLHLAGNLAGKIDLKAGGSLDLKSGALTNTLNAGVGAVSFNKSAAATWSKISLDKASVLTYKVDNAVADLRLGVGQSLSSGFGSQLAGGLVLSGGSLVMGTAGAPTSKGNYTLLTLNSGNLTIMPGTSTSIDLWEISLAQSGDYVFTLVSGAGLTSLNASLLKVHIDTAKMNLIDAPSFSMAANGDLLLSLSIATSLTWTGTGSNVWTTDTAVENWNQGEGTDDVAFADKDFVYFGAAGAGEIVLVDDVKVGTVSPKSMTVDGDQAYSFTGAGSILATGMLIHSGSGALSFANDGVNEFESGIELNGLGKTTLSGKASLKGDLKLSSNLEITSSVVSSFTKLNGTGTILINSIDGEGGASLVSAVQGDYLGAVTMNQGYLSNEKALGAGTLSIAATGNVHLSGVAISSLASLSTTVAGASIHGLTGSLSLNNVSLKLDLDTRETAIINFTGASGSLDMGSLSLDISSLVFSDLTKTYDFVLTNGKFGSALTTMNVMGMYINFNLTGDNFHGLKVLGAKDGVISIGGTKTYENFVLDVNNKWTPHITSNKSAVFTAAQFRTDPDDSNSALFKSVKVDGQLSLKGTDAFTLNHLTGGKTGKILTEGAALTLNGVGGHPVTGETGNVFEGTFSAKASNVTIQGNQSLLGWNEMKTLTLEAAASLTLGAYTKIYGELATPSDEASRVGVTLGDGSSLIMTSGLLEVAGSVSLGNASTLEGTGTLKILAGGNLNLVGDATIEGSIVVNLEHSGAGDGTLDTGAAKVEIAGISGGGKVISNGSLTLNVNGKESFTGTLTGAGSEATPVVGGTIIKTGSGDQVLAATTDKHNLYSLEVHNGTLTLKGKSADYGDLVVGAGNVVRRSHGRGVVLELVDSGHMVIESKITGKNLTVKNDGLLTIGSASGDVASLTLSDTATFMSGSKLEFYVGSSSTAMISAQSITGIANLASLTINAGDFWQANMDLVLFKAENDISDIFSADKVSLIGFDHQKIIYSDDNKTISLSAQRGFDDNPYKNAMLGAGQNANAGMDIIWAANVGGTIASDSNLAAIFDSMVILGTGSAASNRLMAAVAGSTVTALAGSQRDDFRQQQDWIRNRTTGMGISPDYVHEDLPYVNGWIQANGGTTRVSDNGQEAGYDMNTFGGTFGFDVDMSAKLTWGFAFTANYNKLTVNGAETAKGNNDAYYANLFLRTQAKRWANTFIITGGWNDAKLDRSVTGPLVNYTAHGTTSGSTIGAMYETTYDIALNENKTSVFQPLFNASISSASMDAYTEDGAGNAGLHVDKTEGTYGTIALGARLLGSVGQNFFGRTSMGELRLQVAQDIGDDANVAKVGLGGMQREVIGTKVGKTALQLGAGINIPVNEKGSIYIDVNGEFRSESTNVNANVGYRINF